MLHWPRRFFVALQFLTVVTLWRNLRVESSDLAGSMVFYPMVGLLLGLFLAGANYLFGLILPDFPRAVLVVGLWAAVTKFLHLDGLADCADGFWGAREPDRVIEIMRDTRLGAFGVVALVMVLLLKVAGVAGLSPQSIVGLCLVPMWARMVMVSMAVFAPTSGSGLGHSVTSGVGLVHFLVALATAALATVLIAGWTGLIIGGVCLLWALLWGGYARLRLGCVTGDVLGAGGELAEVVALLSLVVMGRMGLLVGW